MTQKLSPSARKILAFARVNPGPHAAACVAGSLKMPRSTVSKAHQELRDWGMARCSSGRNAKWTYFDRPILPPEPSYVPPSDVEIDEPEDDIEDETYWVEQAERWQRIAADKQAEIERLQGYLKVLADMMDSVRPLLTADQRRALRKKLMTDISRTVKQ